MPRPVILRCCGEADYSRHWSFNASRLAPKHAVRRERPNGLPTMRPRDKAAQSRGRAPKSRRLHSNSNIPAPRHIPALALEAGPPPLEAQAGVERWPQSRPAEVPAERAQAQWAARGYRRLPPEAAQHTQVAGPRSHPRALRPGQPMSKPDEIVFSYTLLITSPWKKFHPEMGGKEVPFFMLCSCY
jgi:hypothetical protein